VIIAFIFAASTAVLSGFRDKNYVGACNGTDNNSRLIIIIIHSTAKFFVLFSTPTISVYGASILYSAAGK
jgi:hypothetical protein